MKTIWLRIKSYVNDKLKQSSNFKLTSIKDTLMSSGWMLLAVVGMLLVIKGLTMVIK